MAEFKSLKDTQPVLMTAENNIHVVLSITDDGKYLIYNGKLYKVVEHD